MKEYIKSFLLITLTISALVLTGVVFITKETTVEETPVSYETKDLIKLIRPQNYVFSFGDLFIKIYNDEYAYDQSFDTVAVRTEYEKVLKNFIDLSMVPHDGVYRLQVEPIEKTLWDELLKRRYLEVNYPIDIPFDALLRLYGYNEVQSESDYRISSILMLVNTNDVIYFHDGKNDNYYRLKGDKTVEWIDDLHAEIDEHRNDDDAYKPIEGRYALLQTSLQKYDFLEENLLLTPMSENIQLPVYEIARGTDIDKSVVGVFNNELNFVKKSIYSDNETIYMYGYGEKVLKSNIDGSLEYTVKVNDNASRSSISFIDGLNKSIDMLSKIQAIDDDVENKIQALGNTLYLSDYYEVTSQNNIETIYNFNYTKNGIPYYVDNTREGSLIQVRFNNGELVRVKMNTIIAYGELDAPQETISFSQIFRANALDFEFEYVKDRPDSNIDKEHILLMCLQELTSLETKYMVIDERLIPTWHMVIADTNYVVNLLTSDIYMIDGKVVN